MNQTCSGTCFFNADFIWCQASCGSWLCTFEQCQISSVVCSLVHVKQGCQEATILPPSWSHFSILQIPQTRLLLLFYMGPDLFLGVEQQPKMAANNRSAMITMTNEAITTSPPRAQSSDRIRVFRCFRMSWEAVCIEVDIVARPWRIKTICAFNT